MVLTHPKSDYPSQSYDALNLLLAIHFKASVTFLLLVLEVLKKYHKGDLAGHCPIYNK